MQRFFDKKGNWEVGDTRVRRKFLFFPRQFGRDWRWLEYANIIEECCIGGLTEPNFWIENDFVDNKTRYIEDIEVRQLEGENEC